MFLYINMLMLLIKFMILVYLFGWEYIFSSSVLKKKNKIGNNRDFWGIPNSI